jgi:signal transduction histidine kinase
VDADRRVVLANKNAAALFALPCPDVLGRRLGDLAAELAPLDPVLAAGAASTGLASVITVGRRTIPVVVDVTPLPDPACGGALVVLMENHDTAETARRIEQLESLAGIGEIAAGAIHEIRNPLTSINGFIHLLKNRANRQTDQAALEYCALISEEIGHINNILSDFLALAKPRTAAFAAVDIGRLVRDVQGLIYGEAVLSRVDVEVRLSDGPLPVYGNADKIKAVLINLCRNALDAMPDGGTITITAAADGGTVRVAVADNGVGMPPAILSEIFKPFYTTKENGTGLGLAICRRIMQEHRGETAVESEEGKGTTFTLIFPRHQEN